MESQYCLDYDCNYLTILLLRYVTYGQSRISGSAHVCMISRCEPVQKSQMVSKLPTDFSVLSAKGKNQSGDLLVRQSRPRSIGLSPDVSQEQKKLLTSELDAAFSILGFAGLIYFVDFILFF